MDSNTTIIIFAAIFIFISVILIFILIFLDPVTTSSTAYTILLVALVLFLILGIGFFIYAWAFGSTTLPLGSLVPSNPPEPPGPTGFTGPTGPTGPTGTTNVLYGDVLWLKNNFMNQYASPCGSLPSNFDPCFQDSPVTMRSDQSYQQFNGDVNGLRNFQIIGARNEPFDAAVKYSDQIILISRTTPDGCNSCTGKPLMVCTPNTTSLNIAHASNNFIENANIWSITDPLNPGSTNIIKYGDNFKLINLNFESPISGQLAVDSNASPAGCGPLLFTLIPGTNLNTLNWSFNLVGGSI